jgi:hypothetical protein
MLKGCIESHCNHDSLSTFYPAKADCRRERIYFLFTYNGAYTMPQQSHIQEVGGIDSTPPTTSS